MKNIVTRPTKQIYQNYTKEDFKVWNILFKRQLKNLNDIVAEEFIVALKELNFRAEKIPNFIEINNTLKNTTGWTIKTVPNISPPEEFFSYLSKKKFPPGVQNEKVFIKASENIISAHKLSMKKIKEHNPSAKLG